MMEISAPSLLAVTTGLLGSAWASGAMASLTITGIPAAKAFPETAAQTWAIIFAKGLLTIPPTAVSAGLLYGYAAWDASGRPNGQQSYFTTAAFLSAGVVPFTLIFLNDTNIKLQAVADGVSVLSEASVLALADKWGSLNLIRSLLPLSATLVAGYGLLKELGL
ncbi:hypothetical protein H072_10178 [Dactylellina haptotyla CBS 200.50]|uniref:DUF1772 domain-containing protein n=1 Tax=Dactylellina haptotyla (strain CBS 200.50) TaxID=1284197 RepID=S8BB00_DACHA|nr:hypothetical protein H072_10178 [Dactylellina haptotyla CBS 200.50]